MSTVITERVGEVAIIRLNRPPVHAMNLELLRDLVTAMDDYAMSDARAAVLTAEGRSFCAGVDLRQILTGGIGYASELVAMLSEAFEAVFTVPKPLVAAVNGHALAGGNILTAACDLRLMAEDSGRIGVTELAVGVPLPSWALEIMRFSTNPAHLQEALLGAAAYTPAEGLQRGLLDELVPADRLMERALEAARTFAAIPASTFAHTKGQLRRPTLETVARQAPEFSPLAEALWASEEVQNAIQAFVEKNVGSKSS